MLQILHVSFVRASYCGPRPVHRTLIHYFKPQRQNFQVTTCLHIIMSDFYARMFCQFSPNFETIILENPMSINTRPIAARFDCIHKQRNKLKGIGSIQYIVIPLFVTHSLRFTGQRAPREHNSTALQVILRRRYHFGAIPAPETILLTIPSVVRCKPSVRPCRIATSALQQA